MHKEMESSVFFSIFQLMQFMKYQGMKRMEDYKDTACSERGRMYRWNTPCPYRDGRNNLSGDIKRRGTSDEASACRDEE